MSRQVHQNKYQNKISYLGLALTESGLPMLVWICIRIDAAVDARGHDGHVTTDIQSLSTFMTSSTSYSCHGGS